MRIVYYTFPSFLDLALPFISEMSRRVEMHVLLQIHPLDWRSNLLDLPPQTLPAGILPIRHLFDTFPDSVQSCWKDVASFNLVSHKASSTLHPSSLYVSWWVSRYIRSLQPDIVHLEGAAGRILPLLFSMRNTPFILNVHDPKTHTGENSFRKRLGRKITFSRVHRFILHNQTQVLQFCNHYQISAENVHAIPLGLYYLYRDWINEPLEDDNKTILFFGRISPYKGLEVLIEAAQLVCQEIDGVKFLIAGQPISGYNLPSLPILPNGGKFKLLIGYVSNNELAKLFQMATVVVCPYIDATQSGVVMTAYAFSKPVVATRVGGLPEYIADRETGLLVPPGSPEALAKALIRLLNQLLTQPDLKKFYQKNILEKCKTKLSWDHIAQQTFKVYEEAYTLRKQ